MRLLLLLAFALSHFWYKRLFPHKPSSASRRGNDAIQSALNLHSQPFVGQGEPIERRFALMEVGSGALLSQRSTLKSRRLMLPSATQEPTLCLCNALNLPITRLSRKARARANRNQIKSAHRKAFLAWIPYQPSVAGRRASGFSTFDHSTIRPFDYSAFGFRLLGIRISTLDSRLFGARFRRGSSAGSLGLLAQASF